MIGLRKCKICGTIMKKIKVFSSKEVHSYYFLCEKCNITHEVEEHVVNHEKD